VKQGLADSEGISQLAAEIGVSRYQLIRAFKEVYGLTPEDFRRQARVERARSLLRSNRKLVDIAVEAGFADQSHMTREFRRLVGPSPAAYRAALQ
jgi:AraC-like DNA-binding protein